MASRDSPTSHHPYAIDWFAANAFGMARVLRDMHKTTTPKRVEFLDVLLAFLDDATDKQWEDIYAGGTPQVLLDIASDRTLYTRYARDAEYVDSVYIGIHKCFMFSAFRTPSDSRIKISNHPPFIRPMLTQYRRVWVTIADFPRLIQQNRSLDGDENGQDGDEGFRAALTDLLVAHSCLCAHVEESRWDAQGSVAPYLALLCYQHCKTTHCRRFLLKVFVNYAMSRPSRKHWLEFLGRLMTRHTINPPSLVSRAAAQLLEHDLLDEDLLDTVRLVSFLRMNPRFRHVRADEPSLLSNILHAAQRQMCSGKEVWVLPVLQESLGLFSSILREGGNPTWMLVDSELSHYMILLLARSLVPAAMGASGTDTNGTKALIRQYISIAQELGLGEYAEPKIRDTSDFRNTVRRVWFRARDSLQVLSPSLAAYRTELLGLWTAFGRQCGVNVDMPYDHAVEAAFRSRLAFKSKRCSWIECLCFGQRPQHSLRLCTRCQKVFYCSKGCQTKDWRDGGHKYICCPPKTEAKRLLITYHQEQGDASTAQEAPGPSSTCGSAGPA